MQNANLVAKCLWWVIDDDCSRQISAEDAQVFDVIAINTYTVLAEQPVPTYQPQALHFATKMQKNFKLS